VEIVITSPPRPTPFTNINDTEDKYELSPPPPSQPKGLKSHSESQVARIEVFVQACKRCQKGERDCEVGEVGAMCVGCKSRKYRCDKTRQRKEKTMVVTRPVSNSEEEMEVVEDRKEKKREVVVVDRKAKR
jgi:hypothetical protein